MQHTFEGALGGKCFVGLVIELEVDELKLAEVVDKDGGAFVALLLLAAALGDGMSSSPSGQPPPWTPLDKDIVCCLAEHGIHQASGLEQASEQIWHDENLKVSNLVSYVHCRPSHKC